MGIHMKALNKSFPMNTNTTGFQCFSENFVSLCFIEVPHARVSAIFQLFCTVYLISIITSAWTIHGKIFYFGVVVLNQ